MDDMRGMTGMKARVMAWLAAVLLAAMPAAAQVQTGSILVRVQDESGAAMPGVNITIASAALRSFTGCTVPMKRLLRMSSSECAGVERVRGMAAMGLNRGSLA